MVKSILLPLLEGATSDNAREYAFWFAQKQGALIHALGLIDVKSFEIPVMGTPDGFMPAMVTPWLAIVNLRTRTPCAAGAGVG